MAADDSGWMEEARPGHKSHIKVFILRRQTTAFSAKLFLISSWKLPREPFSAAATSMMRTMIVKKEAIFQHPKKGEEKEDNRIGGGGLIYRLLIFLPWTEINFVKWKVKKVRVRKYPLFLTAAKAPVNVIVLVVQTIKQLKTHFWLCKTK